MPLGPGSALAHYSILGPLGAGAMGEVYRARDSKLGREVAIKVLPEHFADDEERLKRFEREAKTLASLNHPNVAQIFGVDQVEDTCFLVLELVPGESLEERLRRGPLPVDEALEVCRQIAEGLEAAHEAGVIHRDLKPANIRLTPEGKVKVLDFGLAKPANEGGKGSSTDSVLSTEAGRLLGTPTYMAPEQARGKPIDKRVDIWAFGCVLYECLTAKRAFAGETLTDVFAAVLEREPEWEALPSALPARVRALLGRCLHKDPRQRLRDLGEARLELERDDARGAGAPATAQRPSSARRVAVGALAGLAGGALFAWLVLGSERADSPARRVLHVALPVEGAGIRLFPRVSPDGSAVVYGADVVGEEGLYATFLRRFDASEPVRLPGADHPRTLAFSPDGGSLAVAVEQESNERRLVRVFLDQGAPRAAPLGSFPAEAHGRSGLAWTDAGLLVTSSNEGRLLTRTLEGEAWTTVELRDPALTEAYELEVFRALPGGTHVLANTFVYGPQGFEPRVLAVDVRTGESITLAEGGHGALAGETFFFSRRDALYAVGFDLEALRCVGEPRFLVDGLLTTESWQPAWFDAARDGTLVFTPGGRQGDRRELVAVAADGKVVPFLSETRAFDGMLALDREAKFLTLSVIAPTGLVEAWGTEIATPLLRPLVSTPRADVVSHAIDRAAGHLYFGRLGDEAHSGAWRAPLDAPEREERVAAELGPDAYPVGFTPDGRGLVLTVGRGEERRYLVRALEGDPQPRELFPAGVASEWIGYSPRGEWLACMAADDTNPGIVLRRVRADGSLGPRLPVPDLGCGPASVATWNLAASEPTLLVLADDASRILEFTLGAGDSPSFSPPSLRAFLPGERILTFASLADGRLLVVLRGPGERVIERIEVVFGGFELLRR